MRCSAHQDPFHCFTFLFSPRPDIGVTKKELGKSRWGGWLRINRHVCLRLLNKWCVLLLWKVSRESRWKTSGKTASIQVEWNDERSCFSPRPCLTTRSSKGEKGTGWTTINYSSQVNNVFYNQRSFIGWDLHYLPFSLNILFIDFMICYTSSPTSIELLFVIILFMVVHGVPLCRRRASNVHHSHRSCCYSAYIPLRN